tara:strand:- start:281 stop:424 length:144 start_codon:yes stop_codon:yes gene_type:complete
MESFEQLQSLSVPGGAGSKSFVKKEDIDHGEIVTAELVEILKLDGWC